MRKERSHKKWGCDVKRAESVKSRQHRVVIIGRAVGSWVIAKHRKQSLRGGQGEKQNIIQQLPSGIIVLPHEIGAHLPVIRITIRINLLQQVSKAEVLLVDGG